MIRPARREDLNALLELVARKEYAPYPFRGVDARTRRAAVLAAYHAHWSADWDALSLTVSVDEVDGALVGFAVTRHGGVESVTREPQSTLIDHFGVDDAVHARLLEHAKESARSEGSEFLIAEVAAPHDPYRLLLESVGFAIENRRVVRRARPWVPPADSGFGIRLARDNDRLFIIYLNMVSLDLIVPAGRKIHMPSVAMSFMSAYMELKIEGDPKVLTLILTEGRKDVGYLILKLIEPTPLTQGRPGAGPVLAYVYDIAIKGDLRGRGAAQHILRSGENALVERGIPLIGGDISASNPRALRTATHGLGYEIEWDRYGCAL